MPLLIFLKAPKQLARGAGPKPEVHVEM